MRVSILPRVPGIFTGMRRALFGRRGARFPSRDLWSEICGQTGSVSERRMCNCISGLLSITYLKQQILYVVDSKQ
jgi:hypothetical protein